MSRRRGIGVVGGRWGFREAMCAEDNFTRSMNANGVATESKSPWFVERRPVLYTFSKGLERNFGIFSEM